MTQPAFTALLNQPHYCILSGPVRNRLISGGTSSMLFCTIRPDSISFNTLQADSVAFATLLARRLILMNWKSAAPPPYRQWVSDVLHALRMEKIRFAIKQKPKLFFLKVWSLFLEYLKEITVS